MQKLYILYNSLQGFGRGALKKGGFTQEPSLFLYRPFGLICIKALIEEPLGGRGTEAQEDTHNLGQPQSTLP